MKIIAVDNYARESVADVLIAENVAEPHATHIVEAVNSYAARRDDRWYRVVPDDYRLSRGMADLV